MRHITFLKITATFAALAAFAVATPASAQGEAPAPAPAPPPAAAPAPAPAPVVDAAPNSDRKHEFKPWAFTLNPLSAAIARYSMNVEYVFAEHHGVIVSPHGQFLTDSTGDKFTNYGGEVGYHFYTGVRGANGFFVGPSAVYTNYNIKDGQTGAHSGFSAYGAALDIGGQHVFPFGLTVGGGFGLMYLKSSATAGVGGDSSSLKFEGVLPRFLFTVGWSV